MSKKITTISIDEEILRTAKKELPNISIFVEDCLKAFLGFKNTNIKSIDDNMATIRDCLLAIEIASKKDIETTAEENFTTEQENKAWSKIYGMWRNGSSISDEDWENAGKILKCDVRELKELIETLYYELPRDKVVKANDWSFAKGHLK